MFDPSDRDADPVDRDPEAGSDIDASLDQLMAFLADADDSWPRPVTAPDGQPSPAGWKLDRVLVSDVMTRGVVSVTAETPYQDVLALLAEHRLGAVPVVDADRRVRGIVSESDLLAKMALVHEVGTAPPSRREASGSVRRKGRAEDAGSLMTAPAITVGADESVVAAARLVTKKRLRRLLVVDGEQRLVGIITRSDLLRALRRDDLEIRDHVLRTVLREEFRLPPGTVVVQVSDGVVSLRGELERETVIPTLIAAVSGISGVVAVRDHLTATVNPDPRPDRGGRS